MNYKNFSGVFPYLVSPINPDGSIKETVLTDIVNHLIKCGVHGLTPLGSTGEFAYLTNLQRREIVRIVIKAAHGRVPVVAGVCHASTADASDQAREYEKLGADGILAIMDTYFPVTQAQIFSYFKGISESVQCPIVIYNNPTFSKFDLSVDVIERLADIPNIQYLKDASGKTGKLLTIMNRFSSKIKLFSASANVPLFVIMLGGVGWMSGPACIIPRQSVRLYELAKEKRWDEAMELQKKSWEVNRIFQKYNLAACIKAGLNIQGFPVGDPILPLNPLDESAVLEVKNILASLE